MRFRKALVTAGAIILSPVFLLLLLLLLVAKVISLPFDRPAQRTRSEVVELLRRRVAGAAERAEWDDFVCIEIENPTLEAVRKECIEMEDWASTAEPPLFLTDEAVARYQDMLQLLSAKPRGA